VIQADARRSDAKGRRGASIQVGVERDQQTLGLVALIAPTYRAESSYAKRTSIRSVGGAPSTGSFWTKSVTAGMPRQASSSRRPSRRNDSAATRMALACLRPSSCDWAFEVVMLRTRTARGEENAIRRKHPV
jgi:hypothetical protein